MRWWKFTVPVLASILILGAFTVGYSIDDAFAKGDGKPKVTICHVDQETGEEKTISISNKAVSKHIANHIGDHLGECVDEPEPFCGDGVVNQPSEQCDDGNNSVSDGCWLCQLPTGTGSTLLIACSCAAGGPPIFPNMCIESCSGDAASTCSALCLAETGNPTITGATCSENHPECTV